MSASIYREGHEYFVCDECKSHNEIDPEIRAAEFDPEFHAGAEGMIWSATCDNDDCGADLSPFIYNPHYQAEEPPMTHKPDEFLNIKPMPEETPCEVHDWPTQGLPQRLVAAMRATHPKGINACRECVERAQEEGERERTAKCVLCQRGVSRGVGNRGHGFSSKLGKLDTSCPVSLEELTKLEAQLEAAAGEMFGAEEEEPPAPDDPPKPSLLVAPLGDSYVFRFENVEDHPHLEEWYRADSREDALQQGAAKAAQFGLPDSPEADGTWQDVDLPHNVKLGGTDGTDGELHEEIDIAFGGACPVQGEGTFLGMEAYYRARGRGWSLTLELGNGETWTYQEDNYAWPDGGWIDRDESIANLRKAVQTYKARFFV